MNDGGMVFSAEEFADFRQGKLGVLSAKVHSHLPRVGNFFISLGRIHIGNLDFVVFCHDGPDAFRGDAAVGILDDVPKRSFCKSHVDVFVQEVRITGDVVEGAFQLSNVVGELLRNEAAYFVQVVIPVQLRIFSFFLQNGHSGFKVCRRDIRNQVPRKSST